jgi:hypothetical protein
MTNRHETQIPRRSSSRGLRVTVVVLSFVLLDGLTSSIASAQGSGPSMPFASAPSSSCRPSAIRETASTNQRSYGPGTIVKMTASIRNTSHRACRVIVGGTSPSFSVTNSSGAKVWGTCNADVPPETCPLYLIDLNLKPGHTYSKTESWDQLSGTPSTPASAGVYKLTTNFNGVAGHASTSFKLTSASLATTLTVTQVDSGRQYTLHLGDHLVVRLTGPSIYTWTASQSSNQAILQRTTSSSGSTSITSFVAEANGDVKVTATDNPNCYPQCLPPSRLFELTVSVVG